MIGDNVGAATDWVDQWESSIQRRAAQAKSFAERGASLLVTARDPDGIVEVTVDSGGGITALTLSDRIRKMAGHEVADLILSVLRQAHTKLSRQIADVAAETLGADSEATKSIISSYEKRFPAPPEEQHDGR